MQKKMETTDSAQAIQSGVDCKGKHEALRRHSTVNVVKKKDIDDATLFYQTHKDSVSILKEDDYNRLNKKNFWCLLSQTWWIAFLIHLDKSTLSQASTMGIFKDVSMSKSDFNNLFTVFFAGYLIALWPGAALAQNVGHKNIIVTSLFLWALLLGMHPLATKASHLYALRFFLGATESQIVPSTTALHQLFFPPKKSPWVQLLWWASGSLANVMLTLVAYRLIVDEDSGLVGGIRSWKWLHIICVILTFIVCIVLLLFLPRSPVDAKWLNTAEKIQTITQIRNTHAGLSNSTFKWTQVKACFRDIKSWLFLFHMFCNEIPNNTSQQLPLLIVGFGFSPAQSALFNIAKPLWGSFLILVSAAMLYSTELGTGYTCAISYIPCFIGGIIMVVTPFSNKTALVLGSQISTFKPSYLLGLSWAGTTVTGYTKKMCLMSSVIISASVANMISPEFWQPQYAPEYRLPWAFMTASWLISPAMCLIIRWYLVRENKIRATRLAQQVLPVEEAALDTGAGDLIKIDIEDLDLTDRENLRFVYPL